MKWRWRITDMRKDLEDQLREFFKICYRRLEVGDEQYGKKFESVEILDQIAEELADVANYAFLEYLKIQKIKRKMPKNAQ
jgi:hypothetical protein